MSENNVKTYLRNSEVAMLTTKVKLGDIIKRQDLNKTYINRTGNNTSMTDWHEVTTPTGMVRYYTKMITDCSQCPHYLFGVLQCCRHPQWENQFHMIIQYPIPDDCPLSEKRDQFK